MKLCIKCQAVRKSDLKDKLESQMRTCMEHLAKLWVFPNSPYDGHWHIEVWNCYAKSAKLNPSNRLPNPKFVYDKSKLISLGF